MNSTRISDTTQTALSIALALVLFSPAVPWASPGLATNTKALDEQLAEARRQLEEELKTLESHKRALLESRRRLEVLQQQLTLASAGTPLAAAELETLSGGQSAAARQETVDVGTLFDQPSILTPRGTLILEPALQYSYGSSDRVSIIGYSVLPALVIGLIDVRSVNRSTWVASLSGRYGLTPRLEIEAKLPFVYRNDETISRPINLAPDAQSRLFSADGYGLGDIELAARYQLNVPRGESPFYIAGLRLKTRTGTDPFEVTYLDASSPENFGTFQTELPTGSGFYSLQTSLSAVLPSDPAVFFGGINYLWSIKRDVNKYVGGTADENFVGEVDPGDSFGINVGMGLALNEKSAFSLGYEHTWIGKTRFDDTSADTATSTQLASLLLGYSYKLSNSTNLNLSIGAGLTKDTPDTQLTLRLPIRF